jgi:mono/diheme cytochrome c family protein
VALTVFLAVLLPFLYLREPVRQRTAARHEQSESVRLGRATFEEFCVRCHGPEAEGGTVERYVTPGVKDAKPTDVQAPNLREIYSRHPDEDVATVAWDTIQKGRPPTPMPTWGVRYGGPMNDQQITDLVNYLLSIQGDGKQRPQLEFSAMRPRVPRAE